MESIVRLNILSQRQPNTSIN